MGRMDWARMMDRVESEPDRRPPRCQFTDREIVRTYLWAAANEKPVSWACRPESWPGPRRARPTPSTMTRRLRTLSVRTLLRRLCEPARRRAAGKLLCVDGKPLRVSRFSKDKQARRGYGAGGFERGYKLHMICDRRGNPLAFDIRPMNEAECVVARKLVTRAAVSGSIVLGDASYDSNPLHEAAASRGASLLAMRRKPGRGLGWRTHHPGRLRSIELLENNRRKRRQVARLRTSVERYFGWLTGIGGGHLPPWVRTLHRVRLWILAKIALHAARAGP